MPEFLFTAGGRTLATDYTMLQGTDLALLRGGEPLFTHADIRIAPGDRVAVVGPNGAGKSSLFQLLLGSLTQDQGELEMPAGWRISHLHQETPALDRSALDFVLDGLTEWRTLQADIQAAEAADDHNRLATLHGRMDDIQGYQVKHEAEALLLGLGFTAADFSRTVADFSGGWRVRLNLAQALMTPSDLLLLDEPTNHLDIETVEWLQRFLVQYQGTLLVISHDRDFLDAVATHVLSFENGELFSYTGNYSAFEHQRAERRSRQASEYARQQARRAEIESFVARFRYQATKARQAQSRLKALERLTARPPDPEGERFTFNFRAGDKVSDPLISMRDLRLGYADRAVLDHIHLSLHPGMRIGLLGRNGAGKSTFIRHLAGDLSAQGGASVPGMHYNPGYFAQHQVDTLDPANSPLTHLQRLAPDAREQRLRDFLGGFDFPGPQADAAVGQFSGGEKARLALALIAWQQPNLLLLDEPTNHLDLAMRGALVDALQSYEGAVVVVSHDRFLLEATVDNFWLVENGTVESFDGDLDSYLQRFRESPVERSDSEAGSERKATRQRRAEMRRKLAPLKREAERWSSKVETCQAELDRLNHELAAPELYDTAAGDQLQTLLEAQGKAARELEHAEQEWLAAEEQLEDADRALKDSETTG